MPKKKDPRPFAPKGKMLTYNQWNPNGGNPFIVNELSNQEQINIYKNIYTEDQAINLSNAAKFFPNSPELALSFGLASVDQKTLEAAAKIYETTQSDQLAFSSEDYSTKASNNINYHEYLAAINKAEETATEEDKQDAAWFAGIKSTVRGALMIPITAGEMLVNTARQVDGAWNKLKENGFLGLDKANKQDDFVVSGPNAYDPTQIFKATTLYQNVVEDKGVGSGFIPGGEAEVAKEALAFDVARIRSRKTGKLYAYTPGGVVLSTLGKNPEDESYKIWSGVVDAAIALRLDPFLVAGNIRKAAKTRAAAEELRAATEAGKTAAEVNASVVKYANATADMMDKDAIDALEQVKAAQKEIDNVYEQVAERRIELDRLATYGKSAYYPASALEKSGVKELARKRESLLTKLEEQKKTAVGLVTDPATGNAMSKKDALAFIRDEIKNIETDINTSLDNIYITRNKGVRDTLAMRQAVLDEKSKQFEAMVRNNQKIATPEARAKFVEQERAGLLELSDGYQLNKENAINWIFGKNADVVLDRIAEVTSPSEIIRLSKGKFSASLARELADAKHVDDVEQILLGRIGVDVNSMIPRSMIGRYRVNSNPNWIFGDPVKDINVNKFTKGMKFLGTKMPTMQKIHLANTDALASEVLRWMTAARYDVRDIDKVIDELVMTDEHAYQIRQGIITKMLDDTVTKYVDEQNISPKIKNKLTRFTTAYKSALGDLNQYSSEIIDETFGGKVIIDGVPHDLTSVPTSIAQLANTITLPDVYKVRELTGFAARVSRSIDNVVSEDARAAERLTYLGARVVRGTTDGVLRSILLVGRGAFIARNILEMQVRMYLAGGVGLLSNPVGFISMVMSNPNSAKQLMAKAANIDPYLVDINGRTFMKMLVNETPRTQEAFNSFANSMAAHAFSMDGRSIRGIVRNGSFGLIKLNADQRNVGEYSEALASRLLMHHSDPIKRMIATKDATYLPGSLRIAVREGRMTYEDALVAAIREGLYADQIDILNKSVPELQKLMATDKGLKTLLFGDNFNSYAKEIESETLGIEELRQFVRTGKIVLKEEKIVKGQAVQSSEEVFSISSDLVKNHKKLAKFIEDRLLKDAEMTNRASNLAVPVINKSFKDEASGWYQNFTDSFFRYSSRAEVRMVYSPEYRVAYWNAVGEMAPLLSKEAARQILDDAFDIRKTNVARVNPDGSINYEKWTANNPGFAAIEEAAKSGKGLITKKEIDMYAQDQAAKRLSELFYDATQKNNLTYAAQLVFPFANAWANTLKKWGELSANPERIATRVTPALKLFNTLQSSESSAIYDVTGTPHDPNQGFIWSNEYGEKVFTIPLSGNLRTLFGVMGGDQRAGDVTMPVSSLNLAFSGAAIPGSSVGVLPGVGTVWNMLYSVLDTKAKQAVPEVVANWIAPYGDKTGNVLAPAPSWLTKIVRGVIADEQAYIKMAKPIMAWEATNNPKFRKLYDGTPISLEERAALQEELASDSMNKARYQYIMQGVLQNVLPGTPVYQYYAKNKNGDTFMQWQMQAAFNKMVDTYDGNYELAWAEYDAVFGREAVLAAMGQTKDAVFANNEAWSFATKNQKLFSSYNDVIPYFFTGGDFSIAYKRSMERRGKGDVLTAKELTNEADRNVLAAVKGNLAIEAAVNGFGAEWIDNQIQRYKMNVLQGYEPEVSMSPNKLDQKIRKIQSALTHPEFATTAAGSAALTYFAARDKALAQSKILYPDRKSESLSGEDNMENRHYLRTLAQQLSENNTDFKNMFIRVLSQELKDK